MNKRRFTLIFSCLCFLLSGCNNQGNLEEAFAEKGEGEAHFMKIFAANALRSQGAANLLPGDALSLRAVIVDSTGAVVQEVPVSWSTTGSLVYNDITLSDGVNPTTKITYTPSSVGAGNIAATLADDTVIESFNIRNTVALTGLLTVFHSLVPDTISILAGDAQTTNAGGVLPISLKVRVLNADGAPVAAESVTFAMTTGGGSILTAQPSTTDLNGEAEAQVRLGGLIGSNQQIFTATIGSGSVTQVQFTATATPGAPSKLAYTRIPSGLFINTPFVDQPIVEIQDTFGNRVTGAANPVTLSLASGSGALGGSLVLNASNGQASFSNVEYDTNEPIQIIASSPGLTSITSSTITVGDIVANARCASEGGVWVTSGGGCKDTSTGLIWSEVSANSYTWHQAVWDVNFAGSSAQDAYDGGKTNDYAADQVHSMVYDNNAIGYCHDLGNSGTAGSGYRDWRLPTWPEVMDIVAQGADSSLQDTSLQFWTGSRNDATRARRVRINSYLTDVRSMAESYRVRCVRQEAATQITVRLQPAAPLEGFGVNRPFERLFSFELKDDSGHPATAKDMIVSISAVTSSGSPAPGTLQGVTSVMSVNGVASFTNISYSEAGTIRILAEASGLQSVETDTIVVEQNFPYARCRPSAGANWIDADGGCKDLSTGLIYSAKSSSTMNWYQYIWDNTASGNSDQDVFDNGRVNDYYLGSHGASPDISAQDYCKELTESGQQDWFSPNWDRMQSIFSSVDLGNVFQWFDANEAYSTNNSYSHTAGRSYICRGNSCHDIFHKTSLTHGFCARIDAPQDLTFTEEPSASTIISTGEIFDSGQLRISDKDNATSTLANETITLTLDPAATGDFYQNGALVGRSLNIQTISGVSSLSDYDIDYMTDAANLPETINIIASSSIIHNGNTINLNPATSADIVIPRISTADLCGNTTLLGWSNDEGGCRDTNGGAGYPAGGSLVWSRVAPTNQSWNIAFNYCNNARWNGQTDWRLPTEDEIDQAANNGIANVHQDTHRERYIWTSTPSGTDYRIARFENSNTSNNPSVARAVYCVREP